MSNPSPLGLIAAVLALAATAAQAAPAAPTAKTPARAAPSAERYAVQASYHSRDTGRGYSARGRHMVDCLASYRSYDPRTDRVFVRPGVSRRCDL